MRIAIVEHPAHKSSARAAEQAGAFISDVFVVEDSALKGRNANAWALTRDGIIYISDAVPAELSDVVGHHEVVHAVKQRGSIQYQRFLDHIDKRINFQKADLLDIILESRFPEQDLLDLDEAQLDTLYDELNAVVWGFYKDDPANARAQFSEVFSDYDGYIAELDSIMEGAKTGGEVNSQTIGNLHTDVEEQTTRQQKDPPSPQGQVQGITKSLGKYGKMAFEEVYREQGGDDMGRVWDGFSRYYDAGAVGLKFGQAFSEYGRALTEKQQIYAFVAGQNDAAATAKVRREAAKFATVYGKDAGLVADSYTATLDPELVREVNQISKMLGVKTRFADTVADGRANAQIENGIISIEKGNKNPVRFLLGHEITHRIQELSPKSYQAFRDAALAEMDNVEGLVLNLQADYIKAGESRTSEEAMDEIAADFAGRLIEKNGLLEQFIENHREERTLLQRLRDAFHALADKLTGKRKAQVKDAETLLRRAVEDAAKTVERQGNKKAAQKDGGEARYSLNEDFGRQFDQWVKRKQGNAGVGSFLVGTTSDALKSIGMADYEIYWRRAKIAKIMNEHPAMTADVIKSVPNVLENPILVMQSQTVANRITMFGEAMDADGAPVLVAVELSPQSKRGEVQDFAVIASAYGKNNAQNLIDNSEILFVDPDKKRTNSWVGLLGLQLPSSLTSYGSISSITTVTRDVNGNISFGETGGKTAMELAFGAAQGKKQGGGEARYSLNADFGRQFDQWIAGTKEQDRTSSMGRLLVGTTSKALQDIGVEDYRIYWHKAKIAKIMEKHSGMTVDVIKSVPEVLEHPILVMQSQTVANRITLFGEAMDANGAPVLVAVELSPQNKTGNIQDFGVIASAYGKKNAQSIIDASDILYIEPDKKRTDQWLPVLGLQLPSSITTYGSIHSVTQVERDVNGNISFVCVK